MPIVETTPQRLVLKSGSTTLTLDKATGKAILQRKPVEAPLSEITDITIDTALDRASGVEICHTMLIMHGSEGWALPAADRTDAETNAAAMRHFLAIAT